MAGNSNTRPDKRAAGALQSNAQTQRLTDSLNTHSHPNATGESLSSMSYTCIMTGDDMGEREEVMGQYAGEADAEVPKMERWSLKKVSCRCRRKPCGL
jgi:hypothetical protein